MNRQAFADAMYRLQSAAVAKSEFERMVAEGVDVPLELWAPLDKLIFALRKEAASALPPKGARDFLRCVDAVTPTCYVRTFVYGTFLSGMEERGD